MGGPGAEFTPEESAKHIFDFAERENVGTGKFWFKGEIMKW